jgi:hypothetical protein
LFYWEKSPAATIIIEKSYRELLHENQVHPSSLRQGQEEELGALGLLLNVVVHWNAIYMQEVITQLKAEGWVIEDADLARLSPLIWRHINFLGRYNFAVPDVVANGGLRPLCIPGSEWDF